jgi:hypothetical protein
VPMRTGSLPEQSNLIVDLSPAYLPPPEFRVVPKYRFRVTR